MTDWDIGWAECDQQFTAFMPQRDHADTGAEQREMAKASCASDDGAEPRLQLPRADVPHGTLATQIGAELRSVYAATPCGDLPGAEALLAQLDQPYDDPAWDRALSLWHARRKSRLPSE